jgi:hypothetical protein
MLTQPLLFLWTLIINWPKFWNVLERMHSLKVTKEEFEVLKNKQSGRGKITSFDIMINVMLHLATLICIVYANLRLAVFDETDESSRAYVAREMTALSLAFFVSAVADSFFMSLCTAVRTGFDILVNDTLRKTALISANETLASQTENQEAFREALENLECARLAHARLSQIVNETAGAFSSWMVCSCAYVFVFLIMGAYSTIGFIQLGISHYVVMMPLIYLPPTGLCIVKLLLICRSASRTVVEVS